MPSTAEHAPSTHEVDAKPHNNAATPETLNDLEGGVTGRVFSGTPGEPPADNASRVLRSPSLSHSANNAVRIVALKRAQQSYGNRFVQRAIAGIHRSPSRTSLLQRQCACGTCPECWAAEKGQPVQAKLTIGEPGDKYEQEADTVADRVMRMPESTSITEEPTVEAQPAEQGHDEDNNSVMAQSENGQLQASPDLQEQLSNSKGNGTPLPKDSRSFFESALGADLGNVRIHTGSDAIAMNKNLGAHAFTHGSDIYFNAGKYDPSSPSGQHLLVHELAHTVQQGGSTLRAKTQGQTPEHVHSQTDTPSIQAAWYNFDIPFTDYQFDPSIEGIKTAAGLVKDTAVAGVEWIFDEIKSLINSGLAWLREQWNAIQAFASSVWESLKRSFTNIIDFLLSPFRLLADAVSNLEADSIAKTWATFKQIVSSIGKGFKLLTESLLKPVITVWEGISRFATSILNRVSSLTRNFLFSKLPETLQRLANSLIEQLKALWKSISDGWTKLLRDIQLWINKAVDTVLQFIQRVATFAIDVLIEGIRQFGKLVLFLRDLFSNPDKYIAILTGMTVKAFEGVEGRFASIVQEYFPREQTAVTTAGITGTIQRQPDGTATAEARTSASWSDIGTGIWTMMGKKWEEFKSNPWGIVKGLLLDLFLPMYGNIKDVIHLFKEVKKIVTGPLSAGSLEDFWTSLLKILDIPILIYHTIVSILMRSLMVPLVVATFVPHPLVKGIAAAVGEVLLAAFVQAELLNIGHKILLLKTGSITKGEKDEAYNRVADSLIAFIMAAIAAIVMLLLHFIANVLKGIFNFVKGKVFPVETAPAEITSGASGEAPKIEAPETTPQPEAQKVEPPKTEAPPEAPKAETQVPEAPRTETPASEAPKTETSSPKAEAPKTEPQSASGENKPSKPETALSEPTQPEAPKSKETTIEGEPKGPSNEPSEGQAKASEMADQQSKWQQELADLEQRKTAAEARMNERLKTAKAEKARAKALRDRAAIEKNSDLYKQAREAEDAAAKALSESKQATQETIDAQLELQRKQLQLNTDLQSKLPCFAAGTLVWTPTGPRSIDDLQANDVITAYDLDNHSTVVGRILQVFKNRTMRFYHIEIKGMQILATSLHRFWIESKNDWLEARDLQVGMRVRMVSDEVASIDKIEVLAAPNAATFNLHIDEHPTYFVGPGVLVHNAGALSYSFGNLRIYEGVNPKFPDKIYIGQTDDLTVRQGQHQKEAIKNLERSDLTPAEREFWEFKRDMVLKERVSGLNPDQANYLEQKNMDIETQIRGEKNVMNRREQVSRKNMPALEEKIKSDPKVKEAGLCP
jgi:uncharacterized protein DUF4157/pretoxin HINT domain-containing protein